jgi:hypothetical protein
MLDLEDLRTDRSQKFCRRLSADDLIYDVHPFSVFDFGSSFAAASLRYKELPHRPHFGRNALLFDDLDQAMWRRW